MKDIYVLDMLGIKKPMLEREIEDAMVVEIQRVMLELGYGFAFMGKGGKISHKCGKCVKMYDISGKMCALNKTLQNV